MQQSWLSKNFAYKTQTGANFTALPVFTLHSAGLKNVMFLFRGFKYLYRSWGAKDMAPAIFLSSFLHFLLSCQTPYRGLTYLRRKKLCMSSSKLAKAAPALCYSHFLCKFSNYIFCFDTKSIHETKSNKRAAIPDQLWIYYLFVFYTF